MNDCISIPYICNIKLESHIIVHGREDIKDKT